LFNLNFRPGHPADVKREYLFEDNRGLSKWNRAKVAIFPPEEQKYKQFDVIVGYVQRRIAKDRIEVIFYLHCLLILKKTLVTLRVMKPQPQRNQKKVSHAPR
jgi:hypothetical protein